MLPPCPAAAAAGITCHFCRQKKLCGEEGCPRCSRRSTTAECIGKSDCARCHSATGRFCRACLLIRYGQKLEVRHVAHMALMLLPELLAMSHMRAASTPMNQASVFISSLSVTVVSTAPSSIFIPACES
jgi:hypothetical protein